jgi:hypothetical protein
VDRHVDGKVPDRIVPNRVFAALLTVGEAAQLLRVSPAKGGAYCWREIALGVHSTDTSTVTEVALATQGESAVVAWMEGVSRSDVRIASADEVRAVELPGPKQEGSGAYEPVLAASKESLIWGSKRVRADTLCRWPPGWHR